MKATFEKIVLLASIAVGVMVASVAVAGNVANTKHNFSTGGTSNVYKSTQINQVCVFCHAPHNAGATKLLWNKDNLNALTSFRLYTSSYTLRSVTKQQSVLSAGSPSLLCLGCHDGKTAMNVMHSAPQGITTAAAGGSYPAGAVLINQTNTGLAALPMPGPAYNFGSGQFDPSMNLGRDPSGGNDTQGDVLTDDHPIGFSYSAAYTERPAGLFSLAQVNTKSASKVRFFGVNNKLECSSCHDPHVDYSAAGNPALKPFLVMSNSASALCLSCHDK